MKAFINGAGRSGKVVLFRPEDEEPFKAFEIHFLIDSEDRAKLLMNKFSGSEFILFSEAATLIKDYLDHYGRGV